MLNNKTVKTVMEAYETADPYEFIYEVLPKSYNISSTCIDLKEFRRYAEGTKITTFGYINSFKVQSPTKPNSKICTIKGSLFFDGVSVPLQTITGSQKSKSVLFALEQTIKDNAYLQVTGEVGKFDFDDGTVYKYIKNFKVARVDEQTSKKGDVLVNIKPEPNYVRKKKVANSSIQFTISTFLDKWDSIKKTRFLPVEIEKELDMQPLDKSLAYLHGLKGVPAYKLGRFFEYDGFRKRVLVEKIWTIMKNSTDIQTNKVPWKEYEADSVSVEIIRSTLIKIGYTLTDDQKKAIWNTLKLFEKEEGSRSLIFGDVGSGKTVVSLIVAYVLYRQGYQVAILTPSSILAKQHFAEACSLFNEENIIFVDSSVTQKEKTRFNQMLSSGIPTIAFGTTSLNNLDFSNLRLVVIDEEQKFGVKDKEVLYKKSGNKANLVFMTATPIPRSLASTLYSNFTVQKIEQKPAIQKPRRTKIANVENLPENEIDAIRSQLEKKRQILVIVPSISSDEMMNIAMAVSKYKLIFIGFKTTFINGKMKQEEIEENVDAYMRGEYDILISTTMVDAGFSNKNICFVFIENAERFGIAQMHQIRGRAGRGSYPGYCYLSTFNPYNELKAKTKERLNSLVSSENGFELSMKDIEQRGSGDLAGVQQSGSEVNLLEWLNEVKVITEYLKKQSEEKQ